MKRLNRINSKEFTEFHQKRLDEKRLVAYKKLQEEKKLEEQKEREKELSETYQRFKYDWRSEFATSVEEVVEIREPKVETILRITQEKSIISDKNVVDNSENDTILEKMTSSGVFNLTLNAQGDTDIATISGGDSNFALSFDGESLESGSGSGSQGGFNVGPNGYAAFNGEVQQNLQFTQRDYITSPQDARYIDTVSVQAIGGNYSNGGNYPASPLYVYWITDTGSGLLGTIDNASSIFNLTKYSFTLPPAARTEKTYIWCSEQAAPWSVYNGKQITDVIPTTMEYNAAFYFHDAYVRCGGTWDMSAYSPMISCWAHLNRTWSGNPNWGGQNVNIGIDESYPTPVSNETLSMTPADAEAIFNSLKSQFSGIIGTNPLTWGISNIGLQRRTPMNVFVPLDSPEANTFIRTDPIMQGLSALERYKKLEDMLDAGDEYILKALGIQSTGARPVDTGQMPGWGDDDLTPISDNPYGTELGQIAMAGDMDLGGLGLLGMGPASLAAVATLGVAGLMATYNMSKEMATWLINKYGAADLDPSGELGVKDDVGDSVGDKELPPLTDEQRMSDRQAEEAAAADKALEDAIAQYGADSDQAVAARQARNNTLSRHKRERKSLKNSYEPVGQVIVEKKRLKSPKDLQNKIPGYYDGKPAPLGFPMEPPAKMVNGFHADLVTPEGQEKQSNRYNRMDQATAKAMPMTGNPYIDKKVLKARKQPK